MKTNTTKHIVRSLIIAAIILMAAISYSCHIYAASDLEGMLRYQTQNGEAISIQNIEGQRYIFLPADEDITRFTLVSDDADMLISFMMSDTGELLDSINLETCDVTEEGVYQVTVHTEKNGDRLMDFDLNVMQGSSIGTVYYHSDDPVNQGREYVDASKSNKPSGSARIISADGETLYNDSITEIHARGNSTFIHYPKKAYQIKLSKKTALIDGTKKGKTWVLLAIYVDPLRMTDKIAKDIAAEVGQAFAPREEWVDLYYDGEYRGIYLLSEKNQLNSNRVDIADMEEEYEKQDPAYGEVENIGTALNSQGNRYYYQEDLNDLGQTGGFLLELSEGKGDELNWFEIDAKHPEMRRGVNIISPELGSRGDVRYISEYFQAFQRAIDATDSKGTRTGKDPVTGLYYYDFCDIDSLVDEYLIQTIASNGDSFYKSSYFFKDKDCKLYAGPVWDFDQSFGIGWDYETGPQANINVVVGNWAAELLEIPDFRLKVCKRYNEVYRDILQSLVDGKGTVESIRQREDRIHNSLQMDHIIWPTMLLSASPFAGYKNHSYEEYEKAGKVQKFNLWPEGTTFEEIAKYRETWVSMHKAFLDKEFAYKVTDDIHIMTDKVNSLSDNTHERICELCGEHFTEECIFTGIPSDDYETHTLTCPVCGNTKAGTQPCQYIVIEESAPNAGSAGSRLSFCSVCGREKQEILTLDKGDTFKKTFTYRVTEKDKTVMLIKGAKKKTVSVPDTVTYGGVKYNVTAIGYKAFKNNRTVKTLKIGSNVTSIGKYAFKGCTKLKLVKTTNTLETIGNYAFYGDTALYRVSSLKGCTKIGTKAFYKCRSLKTIGSKKGKVQLNKNVKLGRNAFYKSGIKRKNIKRIY